LERLLADDEIRENVQQFRKDWKGDAAQVAARRMAYFWRERHSQATVR
jgi:hypothetical protein